ncbi:MAG: glycosyltransferase family 4 protein [Thermoguttaceae bacterium]|nr:glycosyltransferase family 4 protein [Thermoguttaceae bacterium]
MRTEVFEGRGFLSVAVWEYLAARDLTKKLAAVHGKDPLDLVELHAGGAGPAVAAWSRRSAVPYVFVSHSLRAVSQFSDFRWELAKYYAWSNRRAARDACRVVTVSDALRREWMRWGVPGEKTVVLRAAVDEAATGLATTGHPKDGSLELLYVGRSSYEKGLDLLIDAVAECVRRELPLRLRVAGSVGPEHTARKQAARERLPVEFLGALDNAAARSLMQNADLLVIPSRYDSCPVVALEGLCAGALILAARSGGLPEIIDDGQTGILVPSEDSRALADAIAQVAAKPERFAPIREAARQASRRFTWPVRATEILDFYRDICRREAATEARNGRMHLPANSGSLADDILETARSRRC